MIEIFCFDNAERGIFDRIHHAGERGDSYLERSRIIVRHQAARFLNRKVGTKPVRSLLVTHEENPEFIFAGGNLIDDQSLALLLLAILAGHFVEREHSGIAWMVGVVARRAIFYFAILNDREVV